MTREYLYKVAKLRGFDFETIKELENFMAPRRRFDGVFYCYMTRKYGIVGGLDFGFYVCDRSTHQKIYFDGAKGI